MWLKINSLIVFILLSIFTFSQSNLKGKYYSKSGMTGFNLSFSRNGKFNEYHHSCLTSNEFKGTYQLSGDTLSLIYNLDSYYERKVNLKMVTHLEKNNSLKVVLKINIDTLKHNNYTGIDFLIFDNKDTLEYRKLKSKDIDSFTIDLSSRITYSINFNYKSRTNENDSLSDFEYIVDYFTDIQKRSNYPLYEEFYLKFYSKRRLYLEFLDWYGNIKELEMLR